MEAFKKTYDAIFAKPVAVPELGVELKPLTLAHFAALDYMDTKLFRGNIEASDVIIIAWVAQQDAEAVTRLFTSTDCAEVARAEAFRWASAYGIAALKPLREAVITLINDAFGTAVASENPTTGDSGMTSAGPSNSPNG